MTSKLKKHILATAILVLLSAMTFQCARIGTISGGDKDTTAPVLKRSTPDVCQTEFDGRKVKIRFDEFFQLDQVESKFLLSPPHDSIKPKIKVKGKYLVVKFKEQLKSDTTYTLQFFDAVKDYNEGNKIDDFKFVFSTGSVVDSFAVAGQVFDAETLEKEKEMLVGLYGEAAGLEDSAVIRNKPDYITRTDTAGRFKIENVRPGRYKVFALKDINETQRFDLENEKVAYLKTEIETRAERFRRIDSLPAGTILHVGEKGKRRLDTLLNDTVIIQDLLYTTPNNLKLYSFEEKHLVQYISDRARDIRTRVRLTFNKTVGSDTVLITHVEDTLSVPDVLYDYNYTRDSLILWLRDTADINNDTLKLRVTFSTLDSLKNPTTETDTLSLRFSARKKVSKDKKAEKPVDTGIDTLSFRIKSNFSGDFDIQKSIKVTIPLPLQELDTSMMRLYECVDSSFEEDFSQKLVKSVRLDSANYRLIFKRPILGDIVWYPTFDSIISPNWYTATYSENRDTVEIEVTDSVMVHKSKFPNLLKYHSEYYLGQTQKLRDSVSTAIINQKLVKYDRPSRDTITIKLDKAPTRGVEVSAINVEKLPENSIESVQNGDEIMLILRDTLATHKDTLVLKFNTFDRQVRSKNGKLVDKIYKDTLFAIYKIKYQRLKPAVFNNNDTIIFPFERPLTAEPEVTLVDFPMRGTSWYTGTLSAKRDTFTVVSTDGQFLALDTIRYAISYPNLDKQENRITTTDTLQIVRKRESPDETANTGRRRRSEIGKEGQKQQQEAQGKLNKATLKFPLQYEMTLDSMDTKNRILTYPFEPGKNYMLEIDDSTFTSIYGTPNLYLTSKAKIRELDYYGQLNIDIQNLGNIEHYPDIDDDIPPLIDIDTSRALHKRINPSDTMAVQHSEIQEGQILVCLCNDKGEIKYSKAIKSDSIVKFEYILPADYKIKLIHDRNLNGHWDTGKYIERSYPERVIEFPKKQIVKSKWTTELTWKL